MGGNCRWMEDYSFLRITNATLVLSIGYFYFFAQQNMIELALTYLLVATIIMSQLFWSNPIKGSYIHRLDAIVAKIVIASFIVYTLWKHGFLLSYGILLTCIAVSYYYSDRFSSVEWCCPRHIQCHGLLHYFCFVATFFAFV